MKFSRDSVKIPCIQAVGVRPVMLSILLTRDPMPEPGDENVVTIMVGIAVVLWRVAVCAP